MNDPDLCDWEGIKCEGDDLSEELQLSPYIAVDGEGDDGNGGDGDPRRGLVRR